MLIMSMFGMLRCNKNFKCGFGEGICRTCDTIDDENHRINDCILYKERNLYSSSIKYDFHSIYMEEDAIERTLDVVDHLWDLRNGKNEMRC